MTDHEDRRRSERLPTLLVTGLHKLGEAQEEASKDARVTDLSQRGLFIQTAARFGVGEIVEFSVHLPDGPPVAVSGIVRWRREDDPAGIGVETGEAGPGEARLAAFFGRLREQHMPYQREGGQDSPGSEP